MKHSNANPFVREFENISSGHTALSSVSSALDIRLFKTSYLQFCFDQKMSANVVPVKTFFITLWTYPLNSVILFSDIPPEHVDVGMNK